MPRKEGGRFGGEEDTWYLSRGSNCGESVETVERFLLGRMLWLGVNIL